TESHRVYIKPPVCAITFTTAPQGPPVPTERRYRSEIRRPPFEASDRTPCRMSTCAAYGYGSNPARRYASDRPASRRKGASFPQRKGTASSPSANSICGANRANFRTNCEPASSRLNNPYSTRCSRSEDDCGVTFPNERGIRMALDRLSVQSHSKNSKLRLPSSRRTPEDS